MVSLPPHTSHRLQPLDISFFGPLKNAYSRHCNIFMKNKLKSDGREFKLTHYDIAEVFNLAYCDTANIEKAISGFRSAGIFPLHPGKFSEDDFSPAENLIDREEGDTNINLQGTDSATPTKQTIGCEQVITTQENSSPQPSCSGLQQAKQKVLQSRGFVTPIKQNIEHKQVNRMRQENFPPQAPCISRRNLGLGRNNSPHVSVDFISPVPGPRKITAQRKIGRAKQHSEILTATPLKTMLQEKELKKTSKNVQKINSKAKKQVKKRVLVESESEEDSLSEKDLCDDNELDDIDDGEGSNCCLICGEFGKGGELWYRCVSCGNWAHKECSGESTPKDYICDFCQCH